MAREAIFLGQLEAFAEVARVGNVTKAADALFLSQPALTARIHKLERELGVQLFLRNHQGAQLTEAGRVFLDHAETALAAMTDGLNAAQEASGGQAKELTVASTATVSNYILPPVIKQFMEMRPVTKFSLFVEPSERVLDLVINGDVDVGFCRAIQHQDITSASLYLEDFILVTNADHPLTTIETLYLRDLNNYVLILLHRSASYQELIQAMRSKGAFPVGIIDLDNCETGKKCLAQGTAVAMMPRTAVLDELRTGQLFELNVADLSPMRRRMAVIRRADAQYSEDVECFVHTLEAKLQGSGTHIRGANAGGARAPARQRRTRAVQ